MFKIILDEKQYGKVLGGKWKWAFYITLPATKKRGPVTSLLTVTCGPDLIAVTPRQYKTWNKSEIFRKHRLAVFFNRILSKLKLTKSYATQKGEDEEGRPADAKIKNEIEDI
jgi:hypothetical protein